MLPLKIFFLDELYWEDGFLFHYGNKMENLEENGEDEKQVDTDLVEMKTSQSEKETSLLGRRNSFSKKLSLNLVTKKKNSTVKKNKNESEDHFKQLVEITIKSNNYPQQLFESIHQSVKEFIAQWMVSKFFNQIKYRTIKKSLECEAQVTLDNKLEGDKMKGIQFNFVLFHFFNSIFNNKLYVLFVVMIFCSTGILSIVRCVAQKII